MTASVGRESFEQLDLTGVIEVVRGHARHQRTLRQLACGEFAIEIAESEFSNGSPKRAVHLLEPRDVRTPRMECGLLRTGEPVRALERKRSAGRRRQTTPRDVLPVGRVHDQLPDVVTPSTGPPRRLAQRYASNRTSEVRAVPRHAVVGRVDQEKQFIQLA